MLNQKQLDHMTKLFKEEIVPAIGNDADKLQKVADRANYHMQKEDEALQASNNDSHLEFSLE